MNESVTYHAAGGVVLDSAGRILVLNRPSRKEIRLPKGHVEEGETALEAARREVREESGYADLEEIADLGEMTVEFNDAHKGRHVIRREHYYLFRLLTPRQVAREPKEQQFEPRWVEFAEALRLLTFPSEREFVRRAREAAPGANPA